MDFYNATNFNYLPIDIIRCIMIKLPISGIIKLYATSKYLRQKLSATDPLWLILHQRDFTKNPENFIKVLKNYKDPKDPKAFTITYSLRQYSANWKGYYECITPSIDYARSIKLQLMFAVMNNFEELTQRIIINSKNALLKVDLNRALLDIPYNEDCLPTLIVLFNHGVQPSDRLLLNSAFGGQINTVTYLLKHYPFDSYILKEAYNDALLNNYIELAQLIEQYLIFNKLGSELVVNSDYILTLIDSYHILTKSIERNNLEIFSYIYSKFKTPYANRDKLLNKALKFKRDEIVKILIVCGVSRV